MNQRTNGDTVHQSSLVFRVQCGSVYFGGWHSNPNPKLDNRRQHSLHEELLKRPLPAWGTEGAGYLGRWVPLLSNKRLGILKKSGILKSFIGQEICQGITAEVPGMKHTRSGGAQESP